ncbi:DUF4227 family protein [Paenibacillus sp. J2TS4]|uniref:DUF4227 family protein n=1 Tax=Paenibacillus sp. J2TS4 TaxID=2807194 RepID=UPI001B0899B7|nr:DUF4227 family protein [Paenibacillus sp. J2TS4]GIP32308.1 hypothetical protein J2TS4_15180 [Paenibacillus sp. J2TS4]
MILSVRKWVQRFKFLVTFVILTYLMYLLLAVITEWIQPMDRYREPGGRAVKVFHPGDPATHPDGMIDRLRMFYWYGQ